MTSNVSTRCISRYAPLLSEHTEIVKQLIRQRTPFYVRMQLSPLEAQAANLLYGMVNGKRNHRVDYNTFFCSSTSEAISGALKIVRHNNVVQRVKRPERTLVFDPDGTLKRRFDPMDQGFDEAIVPGLVYSAQWSQFEEYVKTQTFSSLLLRVSGGEPADAIDAILHFAAERGIATILDESSTDLSKRGPVSADLYTLPDVIVWGENLSDCRVPSGCFMMSQRIYQVWNHAKTYNLHSNTWGGNSTSMTFVLRFLESTSAYKSLQPEVVAVNNAAADSHAVASRLYARRCSPTMARMVNLGRLNKAILSARAAVILIQRNGKTQEVIDASGTYGLNLRGHAPEDVIDAVVDQHDPNHDYWDDLQSLLQQKTGLERLVPAVSGATATENLFALALMANAPRRKIVALKGGFSGKTLPALIGTTKQRFRDLFGPLYPHVCIVDPFAADAEILLQQELEGDDVAMVLVETIQGDGGVRAIPQRFLDSLCNHRDRYGYLIAVDEVQTGLYKTGQFLNYQGKIERPDLVAMAKAMSENVFPVAATMVSQTVFERARLRSPEAIQQLCNSHRCQFGAQIAMHAIQSGQRLGLADHAVQLGEYFRGQLWSLAKRHGVVQDVRGEGLMVALEFNPSKVPRLIRGNYGGLFASRCLNDPDQPVLVAVNPDNPFLIRFLPPLCISRQQIDAIVATVQRALKCGAVSLLTPIVMNQIKMKLLRRT